MRKARPIMLSGNNNDNSLSRLLLWDKHLKASYPSPAAYKVKELLQDDGVREWWNQDSNSC